MSEFEPFSKTNRLLNGRYPFLLPYQTPLLLFFFFSFLALAVMAPVSMDKQVPLLADLKCHLAAIIQAKAALLEGQFPLRVMPLEQLGWRYPFYQFSSPTTYMVLGYIYRWLTPDNPLMALKMMIWFALVVGGLSMYRLAFWFIPSRIAAILAGVVYMYAPYYIIIIDHMGALNEIISLGLLPLVLYFTLQRFYHPTNIKLLLLLGLFWYLLITIHMVTFVYTSLFFGMLLVVITCRNLKRWKNLLSVGTSYLLGCLLAAWYLVPVILLQKYLMVSTTYAHPTTPSLYAPTLSQLLSPAGNFILGSPSIMTGVHPAVGWPIIFAVSICLYAYYQRSSTGHRRGDYWLSAFLSIFFLAFFMVWSPINFWQWLPTSLLVAQFSWRLLSQVLWVGSLLFAWALCWVFNNHLDRRHFIASIFLIGISATTWFPASTSNNKVEDMIKQPYLVYNEISYLIHFTNFTKLVHAIDSVLISPFPTLTLNTPYPIATSLLKFTKTPQVQIEGKYSGKKSLTLAAVFNEKVIGTKVLSGHFLWQIPLDVSSQAMTKPESNIKFIIVGKDVLPANLKITLDKMLLTGFTTANSILTTDQMKPYCRLHHETTVCKLTVPSTVSLLELPILYYPYLLDVTINGKQVPYKSILHEGRLVTSVTPPSGENNIILKAKFRGLSSANWVSGVTWVIWIVLTLMMLGKKYLKKSAGRHWVIGQS